MVTEQTVDVTLTPGGSVDVGHPPTGPGAHFFPVFGGQAGVDVADPGRVPYVSVADLAQASWWLSLVYGEEVASVVAELGSDDFDESAGSDLSPGEGGERAATVSTTDLHPGPLCDPLTRYGIGTWIQRWWPTCDVAPRVRIDEALIDLEVGVLAWTVEFVLGGTAVARTHLEQRVTYVLATLDDGAPDNAFFEPVVRAILESVPLSDEQYKVLRAQEERLEEVAAAAETLTDSEIERWYTQLGLSSNSALLAGMTTRGGSTGRTFMVDVEQVPSRSVSWADDAVEVVVTQEGGGLEVSVVVNPGDVATDLPLWARLYLDADLVPVAVLELERDDVGDYIGWATVDDTGLPADLFVDVFTPSLMVAPDPARGARLREAVGPLFEGLRIISARRSPGDDPVQDLDPGAPWRGLIPGALLRG